MLVRWLRSTNFTSSSETALCTTDTRGIVNDDSLGSAFDNWGRGVVFMHAENENSMVETLYLIQGCREFLSFAETFPVLSTRAVGNVKTENK
jgi:hypothetical protein